MIQKLVNFTTGSFNEYTTPEGIEFLEKNIFFGNNGKGKSSFAVGLKEEFLKNKSNTESNFRLFNKEYIKKSLLLQESENKIKGVVASFSERGVEIETKIKELEKELIAEATIVSLESEIYKNRKYVRTEIDLIHDEKKGRANIKKKTSKESVEKVIALYKNDWMDALKIEKDEKKLSSVKGDDGIDNQITQFKRLDTISLPELSNLDIENIKDIFIAKIEDDLLIPDFEIVQWIEAGIKIHQKNDNCKFCNGKLDYNEIESKIKQYKENKKYKRIENMKEFKSQLDDLITKIERIDEHSQSYIILGDISKQEFQNIVNFKTDIKELIRLIKDKIANIEMEITYDFFNFKSKYEDMKTSCLKINGERDEQLNKLNKQQTNLETLVKGAIYLKIRDSESIQSKLSQIETEENDL